MAGSAGDRVARRFGGGRPWALLLGAVLLLVTALASPARADHATEMKARESFAAGRYDQALELFAKLYAETLHPVYLRNIGRCHQKLRQPEPAIDKFREYLAKEKKLSAEERTEIEGYIKEMEALRDEQAREKAPPVPLAPLAPPPSSAPPPALNAPPPTGSASASLLVQAPPPREPESSPIYKRWWFWTAIGVLAAGGVAAALLLPGGTTKPGCPAGVKCL